MATKTVPKRLIYKRATFSQGAALLQDLIDIAVTKFPAALNREHARLNVASLMLNTYRANVGGCSCGVIVRFTRGNNTAILGLDPKAKELEVAQLASPPLHGNKNTEFIENLGYFAVRKNEASIVQSMAVRSGQIQDYLNWLLRQHAALLPATDFLSLEDVSAQTFRKQKISGVKAIHFDTDLQSATGNQSVNVTKARATVTPTGPEFQGLKKLLEGIGMNVDAIPLDPREADAIKISVSVEVNRRSFDEQSAFLNLLGQLANQTAYDDKYALEFDNGLRLAGEELFISKVIPIETAAGIPNPFTLFSEMATYLDELEKDPRLAI